MSEELKPCPFCGGKDEAYEDDFHLCDSCFGLVDGFIEGKKEL